ncbi:MAG: hypothetical protein IT460_07260 [Planctomycetes bacterium]|nr:hypothetical protein [Planctomycetota bacterium]
MATKLHGRAAWRLAALAFASLFVAACSGGGSDGPAGPAGPPGPPGGEDVVIGPLDPLPGVNFVVLEASGGTGAGGSFVAGNVVTIQFTLKMDDGTDLDPASMTSSQAYISGPTTNYNRVIASQSNFLLAATDVGGGVWQYSFPALPSTYLAPLNDTANIVDPNEWTGQALVAGTYGIGLQAYKTYTVDGTDYRDAGAHVHHFLYGGAVAVVERAVVGVDNCNVCHTELRAHGGSRVGSVELCLLCHTAGSEDRNDDPTTGAYENWTPGVTVDFKVMVHKIHNARHLPSVNGVATNPDGSRNYAATPAPLEYVGFGNNFVDLSEVGFPVWPSLNVAMPRDFGYSALASASKTLEGNLLTGVVACAKCHGDPDAGGPMSAPAQGAQSETNPTFEACTSCHDDLDPAKSYTANGMTMTAGLSNATCTTCHPATSASPVSASNLPVRESHVHPLLNPTLDPGVVTTVTQVNGGAIPASPPNLVAGDAVAVTFTVKDDGGSDLPIWQCDSGSAFFFGPNQNRQTVFPYPTPNGMSISPFDFGGRLHATSTSNKGSMSKVFQTGPATAEVLTVTLTSATGFSVAGSTTGALGSGTFAASASTNPSGSSVSAFDLAPGLAAGGYTVAFTSGTAFTVNGPGGPIGSGTMPAGTSSSTRFSAGGLAFNISLGTSAAAAGNTFHMTLFKPSVMAQNFAFMLVVGRTAFAAAANAPDRFYYEFIPGAGSYTANIPMDLVYEHLGDSTNPLGHAFIAANLPVYAGRQQLWEATASTASAPPSAGTTTTAGAVAYLDRQVDVAPVTGFANGDVVCIEPTGAVGVREFVAVAPARADGVIAAVGDTTTRLYFKTPLRYAHAAGVRITKQTLTLRLEGASGWYTLNPATGVVTSLLPYTLGPVNGDPVAIVMSYRSHARFGWFRHLGDARQSVYTPSANDSVDIGQEQGEWKGLPYLAGTYTVDLWLYKNVDLGLWNELQTYRSTSNAAEANFLYASPGGTVVPHTLISDDANCYTCHNDVIFHGGGRRGVDACLTCHSISGAEDKPRWDTPKVGSTTTDTNLSPGVSIEFRQMLHKIHNGKELSAGAGYVVVGNSGNPSTYEEVGFPAWPGEARQCVRCHGNDVWKQPTDRTHASATKPTRVWSVVCGSCHDGASAQAHIASNVSGAGNEACAVCHGPGKAEEVEKVHFPR